MTRLEKLKKTDAAIKFLSLEPLLEQLPDLPLEGIDWVIFGGESGPGARPIEAEWVREIRDNCMQTSIPFFFKQWGGAIKKRTGRTLDGRTQYNLIKKFHQYSDFSLILMNSEICTCLTSIVDGCRTQI